MSIRDLLPLTKNEIKISHNEEKQILLLSEKGEILKNIPAKIINGCIWREISVGIGKPKYVGFFDDVSEVYDRYKKELRPVFNGLRLTDEEKSKLEKLSIEKQIEFAKEHPEKMLQLGKRENGTEVVLASEYYREKEYNEQFEKLKNLHIIENKVVGNLGTTIFYTLSARVSKRAWVKIKDYFYYVNAADLHDEIWEGNFKGYAIKKDRLEELEELLEIPVELRLKSLKKKQEELKRQIEKERQERAAFEERLNKEFSIEKSIEISKEEFKSWIENPVELEGEHIDNPFNPRSIYGTGEWFVVSEDYIWRVYNNGHDGADWSINFIKTGGAGAFGYRFEKTDVRLDLLKQLKQMKK